MSKPGRSRDRQQMRLLVRRALDQLPLEYVVDELVRRFGIIENGYVRLNVRDGFVVGGEYGWPNDDPLGFNTAALGEDPPDQVDQGERHKRKVMHGLHRRPFEGPVPTHLRSGAPKLASFASVRRPS
jgi:hypothetical protein